MREALALERLQAAMKAAAELLGVPPADMNIGKRYPEIVRSMELETMADWTERLVSALGTAEAVTSSATLPVPPDFLAMNRVEVLKLAESYGMSVKANTSKSEAEDFILAALGITENEQAALDAGTDSAADKG